MASKQVWVSYNHLFNHLLLSLFFLQINCFLHAQLCTQKQSSALLQFKGLFSFNEYVLNICDDGGTPKMESWKEGSDCCSWEGIECDGQTGEVTGLDLSCSWLRGTIHPNSSLFLSFPQLQRLNLAFNDFGNSRIPSEFSRFTKLTHLNLSTSNFSGMVPMEISFLNKLVLLDLSYNNDLRFEKGRFELLVQNLTRIRDLNLDDVNMSSSTVPNSLLNLTYLTSLRLYFSGLHGKFPVEIFQLPLLEELDMWGNEALTGYFPVFINSSSPLQDLDLSVTGFYGKLPDSMGNMKFLESLYAYGCRFYGSIPASLGNLTQLSRLDLSGNKFSGMLPSSLSNLRKLMYVQLSHNLFTGPFPLLNASLTKIQLLDLSSNSLTGPLPPQVTNVPPNLRILKIRHNLIDGTIPSWVFALPALERIILSQNKLTGHIDEFQSTSLQQIDLSNNNLHGTVPRSTFELFNLGSLLLFSNNFSGTIPQPNKFSENLIVLDLQKNYFSGTIHDSFAMGNSLQTINLHNNGFKGPVPKSLVNCTYLEVLDLGRNKFSDKFPHWLENLPNLHVLILRSNKLHGPIRASKTKFPFPKLRIIDMSDNYFTGPLPKKYFEKFKAMMNVDEAYSGIEYGEPYYNSITGAELYYNSIYMGYKGSTREMEKVLTVFIAIDLSKNKFGGDIPEIIGRLNSIRGLNLSHNSLTGHMPESLGNLTKLECLDLSSNKLSGVIPQQLTNLISLAILNLSYNQLTGPIPRGKQLDTFLNDSYIDNLGLCGPPLSNTCTNSTAPQVSPPSTVQEEEDSQSSSGFDWEVILPGYGFGLVFGISMGYLMFTLGKPQWLVMMIEDEGEKIVGRMRRHAQKRYRTRIN